MRGARQPVLHALESPGDRSRGQGPGVGPQSCGGAVHQSLLLPAASAGETRTAGRDRAGGCRVNCSFESIRVPWSRQGAAAELRISRTTLWRKMRRLAIPPESRGKCSAPGFILHRAGRRTVAGLRDAGASRISARRFYPVTTVLFPE
ncbi:MAG: hypothetical protein FJW35_00150 [Acidobacteria bacterium]|nr:hypothetical protein [Acidobacteriota bacterium]